MYYRRPGQRLHGPDAGRYPGKGATDAPRAGWSPARALPADLQSEPVIDAKILFPFYPWRRVFQVPRNNGDPLSVETAFSSDNEGWRVSADKHAWTRYRTGRKFRPP